MKCALCGRDVPDVTVHHLVPKDEGGRGGPTADLCSACHRQVHALFDNRTLARELSSIEELRRDPRLHRFVRWVRRQDPGRRIMVRRSRR
jgi:hypothetical protein